ncbi:MAG: C10 family peptidase, partial [Kiritimatiellae bacterium]|nr:C10 family peptidase [Kiritimatiellia bacterium]
PAAAKWARLRAAGAPARSGRASSAASAPSADLRVDYLVKSSWNQSGRGENWYTPGNGTANNGNGWVCGCVATMGGQIMRYWKWPDSSVNVTAAGDFYADVVYSDGTKKGWNLSGGYYRNSASSSKTAWSPAFGGTYDWSNINLVPSSSDSSTKKAALGKLTRDVGLSCYMTYKSGGSGSPGPVLGHRLVDTFGYANAKIVNGWNKDAMLASIDAGMPCAVNVSYSGGGHAIVGDGYGYDSSGTLYVHFNMGWGDVGSDTWYTPPSIGKFTSVGGCVYNIYPPSKGVADLTIVSGRVLSNGSAVGGVTVIAVNRETGASYTATSSNGGTKSFNGETSSTVGKGVYALMLPAGFYTISATSGNSSAKVERQVYTCLSSAWAGANGEPVVGRVGNIHGLDLNLGTAVSSPAVALTHRWSFNGGLDDSKGSSAAAKIGSNVMIADGKAKMTGNGNSQGSLNLGTNLLDTDAATIEIWASQTEVRNWGRIFDYGADTTHYFTLTWTLGSDIMQDRAESKNTGTSDTDNTMAPYSLGVQYHISATFERQGDGGTAIRFMKRDAATGRLLRTGSQIVPTGLHNISNPVLYLGHSFYGADADACAEYDEVRIWKGVLSDAQLSANAKAGPDVLLTSVPASTEYTYVETAVWRGSGSPSAADLANASNWVCTDNNGNTVSGVPGEKTTVIVAGTTAFSIPGGYKPAWRKVQIGAGATATMWATNATLSSSSVPYMLLDANDYAAQLGAGTVDTMQRGLIHNPENNPAELAGHQLRFDGWLKVESAQAGHWKLHGYVDDYIALKIDDEWVLYCRTTGECHGAIDMKAGWHRFTMIAGDSGYGGYGSYIVAGNHKKLTPVGVKINGGAELAFSSENFTFGSGSETVRLSADCDWSALGEISLDGAALDLCGHTLRVDSLTGSYLGAKVTNSSSSPAKIVLTEGGSVDLSNITVDNNVKVLKQYATAEQLIENDATFWLDASVADTLTVNGNNEVTRWASRVGSNAAVQNGSMLLPIYDTTQGYPTVDFGAVQSGKDLAFTRMTDVYTVFMAVKIAKSPDAFWLGDANEYHFHRGNESGYWVEYSNGAYIERMWNGKDEVAKKDIPSDTEPIVVCMEMSRACAASSMTQDRAIPQRNGGKQLSELIVFDYVLTDEQREMVTQYLLDKWPTEHAATPTASPAAATFAADSLSVSLSCATDGATIYYTTDGSEPTKDSTKYTGPIAINATTTIKAKAYADHYLESEVYTGTFT